MSPYGPIPEGHLTAGEVAERFGVSRMTVTRWARTGGLPPAVRLPRLPTLWRERDIDLWESKGLIGFDAEAAAQRVRELEVESAKLRAKIDARMRVRTKKASQIL